MVWNVELSDEVEEWLEAATPRQRAAFFVAADRLATAGNALRMPYSRSLGDGLFELRFTAGDVAQRVTYVFEPVRRVITLTTFRKQRNNERREVARARRWQARVEKKG